MKTRKSKRPNPYLADMPGSRWRDIGGLMHGRLTAIEPLGVKTPGPNGQHLWLCRCECGQLKQVAIGDWGRIKSCGCLLMEGPPVTHGMSETRIFWRWSNMLQRCANPKHKAYPRYGGRGIKVCERWLTFENFYADMGDPPGPDAELDREDNDLGYNPDNVRWLPKAEHMQKTHADRRARKAREPS